MSLVTGTATATTTVLVTVTATASFFGQPTTVTTNVYTTVISLPGQTVTISPSPDSAGESQFVPFVQESTVPQPQYTVTVTEIDAFIQAPGSSIWTTVFYDETENTAAPTPTSWSEPYVPGEKVLTLPGLNNGWASWSTGERAGLCGWRGADCLGLVASVVVLPRPETGMDCATKGNILEWRILGSRPEGRRGKAEHAPNCPQMENG
jgi:hypothetical protein